jgi:deferrochelatase/peroxidase EfeB
MTELKRQRLLASAGVGAAGIGLGGAAGYLIGSDEAQGSEGTGSVPFYGQHQGGIATPAQDRLHFASFGELEAGLFFICFQRDPQLQFVAIQRQLGSSDALNEYIKHVGSAVFAVPPGARPGGYVGEALLG